MKSVRAFSHRRPMLAGHGGGARATTTTRDATNTRAHLVFPVQTGIPSYLFPRLRGKIEMGVFTRRTPPRATPRTATTTSHSREKRYFKVIQNQNKKSSLRY